MQETYDGATRRLSLMTGAAVAVGIAGAATARAASTPASAGSS